MILQATNPASQEMVIFHMMSVRTEMRPTNKSAAAKCLMKKFIRDLRPFVYNFFFIFAFLDFSESAFLFASKQFV